MSLISGVRYENGKQWIHESGEQFSNREEAEKHARFLETVKKYVTDTKVEKRENGAYWVWWSQT